MGSEMCIRDRLSTVKNLKYPSMIYLFYTLRRNLTCKLDTHLSNRSETKLCTVNGLSYKKLTVLHLLQTTETLLDILSNRSKTSLWPVGINSKLIPDNKHPHSFKTHIQTLTKNHPHNHIDSLVTYYQTLCSSMATLSESSSDQFSEDLSLIHI